MHEPGNENYSVVETNGGYRLISDMEAKSEKKNSQAEYQNKEI